MKTNKMFVPAGASPHMIAAATAHIAQKVENDQIQFKFHQIGLYLYL